MLILQIEGSKIWQLYVGADLPPREIQRDKEKAVAVEGLPTPTDVRLNAGDVLYVPRGRVHAAETASEQSIHLTVGIHAPTVLMLAIGALYSQSFRDDRLNARLPARHLDDAGLDATLRDLVREAVDGQWRIQPRWPTAWVVGGRLGSPGPMPTGRKDRKRQRDRRADPGGEVPTALFAGEACRRRRDPAVRQLVDQRRSRPRSRAAFSRDSAAPFRVGDLPGLAATQQTELARTLIVSGFLVRLPDD